MRSAEIRTAPPSTLTPLFHGKLDFRTPFCYTTFRLDQTGLTADEVAAARKHRFAPMLSLIERAARIVAEGAEVDVLAQDKDMTSQEAATCLGVSRQYLVRMLDRGDIPFTRSGSHRRIRSADVIDYRERRDANRRDALAQIAQEAQAAGAYDDVVKLGPVRAR